MDADKEAERGGLPGPSIFIGWGQCLALAPVTMWSCRELNPGPVKPIPDFLHAYPSLDFRRDPGGRRAEDHA